MAKAGHLIGNHGFYHARMPLSDRDAGLVGHPRGGAGDHPTRPARPGAVVPVPVRGRVGRPAGRRAALEGRVPGRRRGTWRGSTGRSRPSGRGDGAGRVAGHVAHGDGAVHLLHPGRRRPHRRAPDQLVPDGGDGRPRRQPPSSGVTDALPGGRPGGRRRELQGRSRPRRRRRTRSRRSMAQPSRTRPWGSSGACPWTGSRRNAAAKAGLAPGVPLAELGVYGLAGADSPRTAPAHPPIGARARTGSVVILNDTSRRCAPGRTRWGVVLICGQGINAAAVAPDGKTARFEGGATPLATGAAAASWGARRSRAVRAGMAAALGRLWSGRCPPISASRRRRPSPRRSTSSGSARPTCPVCRPSCSGRGRWGRLARAIIDRLADELTGMARVLIRHCG